MKYEKPEIALTANAADVIEGTKLSGPRDSGNMSNPIHTTGAYSSDE